MARISDVSTTSLRQNIKQCRLLQAEAERILALWHSTGKFDEKAANKVVRDLLGTGVGTGDKFVLPDITIYNADIMLPVVISESKRRQEWNDLLASLENPFSGLDPMVAVAPVNLRYNKPIERKPPWLKPKGRAMATASR